MVLLWLSDWMILGNECDIPPLDGGMSYSQVSAALEHTVLLRSDGSAVACGDNTGRQCNIPPLDDGVFYTILYPSFCRARSHSPFEKRWSCCGFRSEWSWNVQHSTSWWRSVIHTNLWSVYSHSPFEKRWSCCGFRRECSWKMRHSTSRWRNVIQPSFCRLPSHNTS